MKLFSVFKSADMDDKKNKEDMDPKDLPQSDVFAKKEIYQYPQPADTGTPLKPAEPGDEKDATQGKEEEKTSKEEGLNEERSKGGGGAFEGFEADAMEH